MTDHIGSGTAQGVIDYLDSLVEKGRSRPGVVNPLKTALTKVLQTTEGEDSWGAIDVTVLDVNDVISRFKNKTLSQYTAASYDAYQSRMVRAIGWYKNFLANPGWVPAQNVARNGSSTTDTKKQTNASEQNKAALPHTNDTSNTPQQGAQEIDSIPYPFPLENGKLARFYVPTGMTKSDVDRITGFLNALVIEKKG
jgi:hypothetical protein